MSGGDDTKDCMKIEKESKKLVTKNGKINIEASKANLNLADSKGDILPRYYIFICPQ